MNVVRKIQRGPLTFVANLQRIRGRDHLDLITLPTKGNCRLAAAVKKVARSTAFMVSVFHIRACASVIEHFREIHAKFQFAKTSMKISSSPDR